MILSLLISTSGCSQPPSTPPLAELPCTAPPPVFVERNGPPPPGVVELGPTCPAEVGDFPSSFFGDRLLVRLPPGVEGEQIPEQSPNFARSHSPIAMGCETGLAASVFVDSRRERGDRSLADARERLFSNLNFPDQRDLDVLDGSDEGGDISVTLSFPEHPVWGSTRVYLRMIERYDRVHTIGFLAERDDYHQLEPLLKAAAASMVILP